MAACLGSAGNDLARRAAAFGIVDKVRRSLGWRVVAHLWRCPEQPKRRPPDGASELLQWPVFGKDKKPSATGVRM